MISHISFLDSTWARFAHETSPHCIFNETPAQLTRETAKSLLKEVELLQTAWQYNAQFRYNVPFPNLRTVTQLPVSNTQKFHYQTIPVHLLNARHSTFSRLMTLMNLWLIRVSLVADKVFTHKYDTGRLSWFIQCWDIVQSDRKRGLSTLPNEGHPKVDVSVSGVTGITRRCHYSGR